MTLVYHGVVTALELIAFSGVFTVPHVSPLDMLDDTAEICEINEIVRTYNYTLLFIILLLLGILVQTTPYSAY
jgi:hypothetical protein